jgi:hypothetical protein
MRTTIAQTIYLLAMITTGFMACTREDIEKPTRPPVIENPADTTHQPGKVPEMLKVKLQAVIRIGSITYDSLPAQFGITTWDEHGTAYHKDTLLGAGVNQVSLPKAHNRFKFSVSKWGITDEMSLNKEDLQENVIYTLGGGKGARKLQKEESFLFVAGAYQQSSKTFYTYNERGLSAVEFYQKKPQSQELQFTNRHLYTYSGANVSRIDVVNAVNGATGFTEFTYNEQGNRITNMHQKSYDVETFAAVEHGVTTGAGAITIDYLYNNGQAMEYRMQFRGGNKTEDGARSSTGGGEGGTYKYDFNINPFAHMNMPNMYLSNLSKNNLTEQNKNYSGVIPSAVLYKYEYTYDNEGYPVEVVKHYKNGLTGEHLYKTKTLYTY